MVKKILLLEGSFFCQGKCDLEGITGRSEKILRQEASPRGKFKTER
jgi:hypothetical protein